MYKYFKNFDKLFSTRAAGLYLLLFAVSIGAATFIENDYGTSSAQELVFRSSWFELLLILFGLTIIVNIKRFRMIEQKKWAALCFHFSIIIILIGSAATRYFGYEGMMHIREGETANSFLSSEMYLKFKILQNNKTYSFDEKVFFATKGKNKFSEEYQIGQNLYKFNLKQFIPNPKEKILKKDGGLPIAKLVIAGNQGREEFMIHFNDKMNVYGTNFNFTNSSLPGAFNIFYKDGKFSFITDQVASQMMMATQKKDSLVANVEHPLMPRSMYVVGGSSFVFGELVESGETIIESESPKVKNESLIGLNLEVIKNGVSKPVTISGLKGDEGRPQIVSFDDSQIMVSYGSKPIKVPFGIKCRDFILEKYPGTENASSYASEVTLIDPENGENKDQRIYMNHILDHGGYRFFQSSFDPDELGTYLSVNHDFWGTWISYIGYALLTIGMALTFFYKNTRFSQLMERFKEYTAVILILLFSFSSNIVNSQNIVSEKHATVFGNLMVQDQRGRIKPVNTLTNEILRKVYKKESFDNLNSDQVILSMMVNPQAWEQKAIIAVPMHPKLAEMLGSNDKHLSFRQFFDQGGQYKLKDAVRSSQSMNPKDQGTLEKSILKVDEKVNIVNMIFNGALLKIFPLMGDKNNLWISPSELMHNQSQSSLQAEGQLYMQYINGLNKGVTTGDYSEAELHLKNIKSNQVQKGNAVIPSSSKIKAEMLLNKVDFFGKLRNYYGLLALILLGTFLALVIKQSDKRPKYTRYAFYLMAAGFVFHTIGLGLRWYVSGRAPWSNGYESMIYIGWTTMLAGTLFSRKSLGGLTATATLAATVLLVASMSWLDPEITPLVPVLKSYWLTIHVSLEAGSYGFLMLGAVIGMLNLLLMVIINKENQGRIKNAVKELTIVSEITLLGGLFMVSVGTYLGGVWANESWGRYWGWDAKETWALVTILVYSFILHMRFIPGLQSVFAFNFASLFGFATVIMTYFGVNYYLSGLHSYAAGDPVPVPSQVYYTAIVLMLLSFLAFIKYKKVWVDMS